MLGTKYDTMKVPSHLAVLNNSKSNNKPDAKALLFVPRDQVHSSRGDVTDVVASVPVSRGGGITKNGNPFLPRAASFLVWAQPLVTYIVGLRNTREMVECLTNMEKGLACHTYDSLWENVDFKDILKHIKWGNRSMVSYLLASFFLYPMQNVSSSQRLGAIANFAACFYLVKCLIAVGTAMVVMVKQIHISLSFVDTIVGIVLFAAALPFFQLITWQVEYGARALLDAPGRMILPKFILLAADKTSFFLNFFLVGPFTTFLRRGMRWGIFSAKFHDSGAAYFQTIADADYYSRGENASKLKKANLYSINRRLVNMIMHGILVVIPTWAILTNFGMIPVFEKTQSPGCIWSTSMITQKWDPASIGVSGIVLGPYMILTVLWTLLGMYTDQIYHSFWKFGNEA